MCIEFRFSSIKSKRYYCVFVIWCSSFIPHTRWSHLCAVRPDKLTTNWLHGVWRFTQLTNTVLGFGFVCVCVCMYVCVCVCVYVCVFLCLSFSQRTLRRSTRQQRITTGRQTSCRHHLERAAHAFKSFRVYIFWRTRRISIRRCTIVAFTEASKQLADNTYIVRVSERSNGVRHIREGDGCSPLCVHAASLFVETLNTFKKLKQYRWFVIPLRALYFKRSTMG
jgi:hypothetical protein